MRISFTLSTAAKRIAAILIALWIISGVIMFLAIPGDWEKRGQFGDMFGAVNSLFSALALMGVIGAVLLQMEELVQQRRDFDLETKRTERKTIEDRFFQLLSYYHFQVSSLRDREKPDVSGRTCFERWYSHLRHAYDPKVFLDKSCEQEKELVGNKLIETLDRIPFDTSNYYRTLHNILRYIKGHSTDDDSFYIELLETQLSQDEKHMIFYYCLSKKNPGFSRLVEEFGLLMDLDPRGLLDEDHICFL